MEKHEGWLIKAEVDKMLLEAGLSEEQKAKIVIYPVAGKSKIIYWDLNEINMAIAKVKRRKAMISQEDKVILEFPVLWEAWESDSKAWVMERKDGTRYLIMTEHGCKYEAELSELKNKVQEYTDFISKTNHAIALLKEAKATVDTEQKDVIVSSQLDDLVKDLGEINMKLGKAVFTYSYDKNDDEVSISREGKLVFQSDYIDCGERDAFVRGLQAVLGSSVIKL